MEDYLVIDMPDILKGLADIDRCLSDSTLVIHCPTEDQRLFLDRVLNYYNKASAKEREDIYNAFRSRYGLLNMLIGYVYRAAEQIRLTGDQEVLHAGLTAASIENSLGKVDYRDRLLALAELYVTAEEAGMNPGPAFENLCGLTGFSEYAVVRSRRHNSKPWS
jgi:hypothetical protein